MSHSYSPGNFKSVLGEHRHCLIAEVPAGNSRGFLTTRLCLRGGGLPSLWVVFGTGWKNSSVS